MKWLINFEPRVRGFIGMAMEKSYVTKCWKRDPLGITSGFPHGTEQKAHTIAIEKRTLNQTKKALEKILETQFLTPQNLNLFLYSFFWIKHLLILNFVFFSLVLLSFRLFFLSASVFSGRKGQE